MQEALPYKAWTVPAILQFEHQSQPAAVEIREKTSRKLRDAVTENAVIVIGRRGCCMSHVVKRLLNGHGVNPAIYEVDEEDEDGVVDELEKIIVDGDEGRHRKLQFPAVFIGGRWYGGLDRIMATHINGELIPVLKQAGALWL